MIGTTCTTCGCFFRVADGLAETASCPQCGPAPTHDGGRPSPPWMGAGAPVAVSAPETGGGHGRPPSDFRLDDDDGGGSDRNFSPWAEDEQRSKHLFRIGLAMTIAFFAPIVGIPGQPLLFPELHGEIGVLASGMPGLVVAVRLLPLIAGVVVILASFITTPPVRGMVVTACGAALFGLFVVDGDARQAVAESFQVMPGSMTLSVVLGFVGVFGMLVSARVRWYRPTHAPAHWIGVIAAVSYGVYLVMPTNGGSPIAAPFQMFRFDTMMGIASLANVGCLAGAAVVSAITVPSTPGFVAVTRARLCFRLLVASVAVPLAIALLGTLCSTLGSSMGGVGMIAPLITSGAKYAVMFGGLLLLIPVGITDLVVGRTPNV